MHSIWQVAGGILETATSEHSLSESDLAILVDDRNGIRIVNGTGWQLDALRTEYQAGSAFLVRRTPLSVKVEAQSGFDCCSLERKAGGLTLAWLTGGVAHHLIHSAPRLLTVGV